MAVLIIGAGLVGSQLARILIEQGEAPVLLDRAAQPRALAEIVDMGKATLVKGDVLKPLNIAEVLRTHAITEIIHLAANPLLTQGGQREPYNAIELNIMGTTNVLEAARVLGVKRVVVASSSVLNHHLSGGEDKGDPMREQAFPRPTSFYSSCKQAVEAIGLNYAKWCGVEFAAVRYGAVAGPWGGDGGGGPSNAYLAIVQKAVNGEEAVLPSVTMEWVYSKDAARATLLALRTPQANAGIFNVTMGAMVTPEQLAAALTAAIPGARYRIDKPADGVSMSAHAAVSNINRAKQVLGFEPRYQMADAIRDTVDWFRGRKS
ncbi:MAG: NAD(P)-dependent oxidoreductase [Betaproteobacteria bacterium]|nr:NAD(P)-dependent oxidoreductase [Betaproteobacteria bacterium]